MFARFQLKRWRRIRVQPRGAQVRRGTGSREAPDSSQKTMTALRRRAFLPDPGPVADDPAGDRFLVAFDRTAGGALQPEAQPAAQDLPDVGGVVGDPGDLLDHLGDPIKRPQVGGESVRPGALVQGLPDGVELFLGHPRGGPGRPGAAQRWDPTRTPAGMPAAHDLLGDAELAGDLSLGVARVEQRTSLQADPFECLAVTHPAGVAAVGGWSHPTMLPGQPAKVTGTGEPL